MAPWPEVGERKAPDKENKTTTEVVSNIDIENSEESGLDAPSDQVSKPEDKVVRTLDEGQLKALLDEAMTYKNPKDREGKSELFNELLQEAEADESNIKLSEKIPKSHYSLSSKKRHNRQQGRECGVGVSTSRGGSLQNLHALGMDGNRGTRSRRSGRSNDETLVSARQREGGSLPSNVNVDDIDSSLMSNYKSQATLQVSEANAEEPLLQAAPEPNEIDETLNTNSNTEVHVYCDEVITSASDDQSLSDSSDANRIHHEKAVILPRCDTALVPVIIHEQVAGGSYLGLPLSAQWRRYSSCTFLDFRELGSRATFSKDSSEPKAKSLDENGNALGVRAVDSNFYQDRLKKRRVKTKNDRNIRDFMSNDIEGYRGGADIDTLMEYIETPSNNLDGTKSNKTRSSLTTESRTVKRRTKEKIQRCNSLEEISKTKLKYLSEENSSERINGSTLTLTKRQVTLDDTEVGKKTSWRDLASSAPLRITCNNKIEKTSQEGIQDSEFHIVTKKHRKKKRRAVVRTGSERMGAKPVFCAHDRTLEYRHRHASSVAPQPRRKSASSVPPSDKSDSSDLDSVHSLPVSSTTARANLGKNSVSGGSTPQASYADIAKSVGSSQDIDRGKCLPDYYCADSKATLLLPVSSSLKKDAMTDTKCDNPPLLNEEYPPLDVKSVNLYIDRYVKLDCVTHRDNKISEGRVILKTVPIKTVIPGPFTASENVPDSLDVPSSCACKNFVSNSNSKRPPVILVDEPFIIPHIPTELTFGFEVNQQLLESDNSVCNLDNVSSTSTSPARPLHSVFSRDSSLDMIVYFHSTAWEKTLRDVAANRARFYDGQ